jgi:hypothetical protein
VSRRPTSNKKVARAASTGGGRTARGRTPWAWYTGLTLVVLLGVWGVAASRSHLNPKVAHPNFQDHWHMAYGIYICNEFRPPMPQPAQLIGLHTHTDGLIHVEPFVTGSILDRGDHVTLARFVEGETGFKLTSNEIQMPGGKLMKNGDQCDGKPGKLTIRQWKDANSNDFKDFTNPKDVKITDGGAITMAFLPEGADIAKPGSIPNLANPNAGEGAGNMPQPQG